VTKNRFWGFVLDLMGENDPKANDLFFPTVRRLLAKWDGPRRLEAYWDDVVQDTAQQIWQQWRGGGVDRPWALLCTIAKRRFLDRTRATRDADELPEDARDEGGGEAGGGGLFTSQALAILEEAERDIIVRMDLEGQTRLEVARELGKTEGEVLSIRRAGLRRIWRWIGRDLPPRLRAVWEEMFKGAKRATPEEVAEKLGIPREEVLAILSEAQALTGVG
jgi:DNA-directed RNA polymerase specialized sigma24 family protein